jgi:hypothetical protein
MMCEYYPLNEVPPDEDDQCHGSVSSVLIRRTA